jgi:hypothetical protein
VAAGFVAIVGVSVWRMRSVDELPDVGDPFDVAEARHPVLVPDADNAYVSYAEAQRKLAKPPVGFWRTDLMKLSWSTAGAEVRDFVAKNRAALKTWRDGTERPDALYHQPDRIALDTVLPVVQDVSMLARLAGLEGSRHEEKGEMKAAWTWYRAMLRSSRHVGRHGVIVERNIGAWMHENAGRRIVRWSADPRVDAQLLRRALEDTIAADAMTPPLSDALKLEYLVYLRDLGELRVMVKELPLPGGPGSLFERVVSSAGMKLPVQHFRLRATNDVERSGRALRLLFSNWLAQVDRPEAARAPIAIRKPMLVYAADPTAPPAARAVDPQVLNRAVNHTVLAEYIFGSVYLNNGAERFLYWEGDGVLAREGRRRSALFVKLAAELYRRERGQLPATCGALLGPYLKVLPEGIARDAAIPAGVD